MLSLFIYGIYLAWPVLAAIIVFFIVLSIGKGKKQRRALFPYAPMRYRGAWLSREEFKRQYPHHSYDAYIRRSKAKHKLS